MRVGVVFRVLILLFCLEREQDVIGYAGSKSELMGAELTHLALSKLDVRNAEELLQLTCPSLQVLDLQGFTPNHLDAMMTRQPWPST